jgi:O-antigen ligase
MILFRQKRQLLIAASVLAGSMLLVTLVILFRHAVTGFSFASINDAAFPFFRNHVNYSAMLVCMLPVLVGFFVRADKSTAKRWLGMAIALVLVALFFSYARGAWLALLVGVLAWWLMRKKLLVYAWLFSIILVIGLIGWLKTNDRYLQYASDQNTTIFHSNFNRHLVSTYQLKDLSTAERFYRWIAGVRMIKDNWLTGYGPNTFYEHYKGYAIPAYKTWVSDNPERSTVHNYFLFTAIEQGIPGLIFLLVLLGAMFYYAQHIYQRSTDPFNRTVAAVCGVMITMITTLNFFSDLVETDKIGSLFFLCLSTLIVADKNSREPAGT